MEAAERRAGEHPTQGEPGTVSFHGKERKLLELMNIPTKTVDIAVRKTRVKQENRNRIVRLLGELCSRVLLLIQS